MSGASQVAAWWADEKVREFTKLECGLLGALFCAVGIGLLVAVASLVA